uniref:(northern house mosquito) hypothetical protein n=1 Tax=Culex pipiens TaxID=7175 RepID=A0A8D8C788_CULPI
MDKFTISPVREAVFCPTRSPAGVVDVISDDFRCNSAANGHVRSGNAAGNQKRQPQPQLASGLQLSNSLKTRSASRSARRLRWRRYRCPMSGDGFREAIEEFDREELGGGAVERN